MKQNLNLFIRTMLPLTLGVTMIFLLQGCLCKECAMAVSQQKRDRLPDQHYTVYDQTKSEAGRLSVIELPTSRPTPLQEIPGTSQASLSENIVNTESGITSEIELSNKSAAVDVALVNPIIIESEKRNDILIEKIIAAKIAKGKNCRLGIRSISSQIIAGPNISFKSSKEGNDSYGNNGHKHQPGAGFQLGMGSNLVFSEKFSVSPSILIKQNNASEKITYRSYEPGTPGGSSGETKDKYSYTYLSAPVTANYQLGKQVQVFAGPELNYLLRARVKTENSTGGDDKENITKNSVKLGVGVQAGIKYKIPSGNGDSPFGVQLLYEHRISRLNKKNTDGYMSYNSPAWNMKGFQLGITCSICNLMKGN